jgi:hypothetical protein
MCSEGVIPSSYPSQITAGANASIEFVRKLAKGFCYCVNRFTCGLALLLLFCEFVTHDAANFLFKIGCHLRLLWQRLSLLSVYLPRFCFQG